MSRYDATRAEEVFYTGGGPGGGLPAGDRETVTGLEIRSRNQPGRGQTLMKWTPQRSTLIT
jgi:hypothetical protein